MSLEAEFIERDALVDLHAAASPELAGALRLMIASTGSAFASVAGALPASAIVVNRAIGAGFHFPETEGTIRELVATYRSAGVDRFFIHRHPHARPRELGDWLSAQGLEKARGWQKFRRGPEPAPPVETDLTIRQIGPAHACAFGRIASDAFDLGPAAAPWLATLPGRPGWHVFMSFDGEAPAGVGALFVKNDLGWFDWGATAPQYRRRGSQSALLTRRIGHALDLGCRALFTCTGEDAPGDPQHSYKNIKKMGFEEDYLRENYAPPKL